MRYEAGGDPFDVAMGDVNGDGVIDIAIANVDGPTVSVMLGDGAGGFALHSRHTVGGGFYTHRRCERSVAVRGGCVLCQANRSGAES